MFPEDGFTKAELLLYYQTIAPLLLPHLRGRPLTLKAFSHGVKERPYYRRRLAAMAPKWLSRVELEDGAAPVVEDAADLLWVVNQDSVEIHPWLSLKENLNYPDLLVFETWTRAPSCPSSGSVRPLPWSRRVRMPGGV